MFGVRNAGKNEATAFGVLANMVEVLLPGYYVPSLIGVACDSRVINDMLKVRPATSHCRARPSGSPVLLRCYLQLVCPRLSNHFDLLSMPLDLVVNEWLMCAFATLYPSHTVLHLWDAMLLEVQQSRPRAAPTVVDSILLTQSCYYVLYRGQSCCWQLWWRMWFAFETSC